MSDDEQTPEHSHPFTGLVPRGQCAGCDWHREHTAKVRPQQYTDPAVPTLRLADPATEG